MYHEGVILEGDSLVAVKSVSCEYVMTVLVVDNFLFFFPFCLRLCKFIGAFGT